MKILDHGSVELVSHTPDPALQVVNAARCSYKKTKTELDEKDRKLTKFLYEHGHSSPFRHTYLTFKIKAPLFVFRQWTKYQVGSTWREYELPDGTPLAFDTFYDEDKGCSWNELSGRYSKLDPEFYVPHMMRTNAGHGNKQGSQPLPEDFDHDACRELLALQYTAAMDTYEQLLDRGVAKELARLVLPSAIYSQAYWTVSLQSLLHFLEQRLPEDAQWEIQQYALGIMWESSKILANIGFFTYQDTDPTGKGFKRMPAQF